MLNFDDRIRGAPISGSEMLDFGDCIAAGSLKDLKGRGCNILPKLPFKLLFYISDEELRNQGRCRLTPEEIGLFLAALGFNNKTRLYLASHKVQLQQIVGNM